MDAEITIIGAGVVGLAIAEKITGKYSDVYIIEKHLSFGQETSSRNSEVIHAGIYYPQGSLKSELCVTGRIMLYEFCRKHDVPYNNCGKLIVATSAAEIRILEEIVSTARKNNVHDLRIIEEGEIRDLEPSVFALKAILSPSTGIIDSHSLMKQLETNVINNNGKIVYGSEVKEIRKIEGGYEITLKEADGNFYTFTTAKVINSAGLTSDKIPEMAGMKDENLGITFCKGEYFRLKPPKNKLINRLIYPVPHQNLEGIGIHVTIDMGGGVKLGPDVTWLASNTYDFSVDAAKHDAFLNSAKKFLPFLEPGDIYPEMAGIRPKIQKPGEPVRDFYIMEETRRGYPGFVNLIGIESPGLTSCLAIGEYVLGLIG
jgi:L-2-hydroxyglutarate oxidase LhgO